MNLRQSFNQARDNARVGGIENKSPASNMRLSPGIMGKKKDKISTKTNMEKMLGM